MDASTIESPRGWRHTLCGVLLAILLPNAASFADAQQPEGVRPAPEDRNSVPISEAADGQPDEDPLERAIGNMRQAERRISARDIGEETQSLQRRIIDDLDQLIELAKRQSGSRRPPSGDSQPKDESPQDASKPEQSAGQESAGGEGSTAQGQGATQQESDQASQSTDRSDRAESIQIDIATRNQLINEIWGHLPPALRQRLLNIREEKYLPKYGDLVRQYFEALAEQGTNRKDGGSRRRDAN